MMRNCSKRLHTEMTERTRRSDEGYIPSPYQFLFMILPIVLWTVFVLITAYYVG